MPLTEFLGENMEWVKKIMVQRWLKELRENIDGMKRMAEAYEKHGGFKEVAETLSSLDVSLEGFTPEFIEAGRKAEIEFANACRKLADCYDKLYDVIKKGLEPLSL
jgi:hypothetical protein